MGWTPHTKQVEALKRTEFEILFGGSRGGGKTDTGIHWLIYDSEKKDYRALVIRRNATDLHDWIDRAKAFFAYRKPKVIGSTPVFEFPGGGKIFTGHLKDDNAYEKYKGQEYCRMLIEELTQIPTEALYMKLIASCRSTSGIKPQVFGTTNPDGPGHVWVKRRFVSPQQPGKPFIDPVSERSRIYIPATVADNPTLIEKDPDYVKYLESLPEDLKMAWRYGSWDLTIIKGSIYGEEVKRTEMEDRFGPLSYDPSKRVYTFWDLGVDDEQTCIFVQANGDTMKIFDSYKDREKPYEFYGQMLTEKGYKYGTIFLPHDGTKRSASDLLSFKDYLEKLGHEVVIVPRTRDRNADIDKTRIMFKRFMFDSQRCPDLFEALRMYRREYDEERNIYKATPYHNWTSHWADALRCLGVALHDGMFEPQPEEEFRPKIPIRKLRDRSIKSEELVMEEINDIFLP